MVGAGIHPGDILVVDRSIDPHQAFGHVLIAAVEGELTVKRLVREDGVVRLQPDNPQYPPIELHGDMDTVIWGVVTGLVRSALCPPRPAGLQ